jgi:hypothetical protein
MRYVRVLFSCLFTGCLMFPSPGGTTMRLPGSDIALAGGCISPAALNDSIRLDSMQVTIRLKQRSYLVDAVFIVFNTSETTTERVGLPKHGKVRGFQRRSLVHDFLRFDGWVDGRKTEFGEERDFLTDPSTPFPNLPQGTPPIEETRWLVTRVVFPALAQTTIRIRYEALYDIPPYSLVRYEGYYYYGTARYWKGKIGKAAFIIDSTDIAGKNSAILFNTVPNGIWFAASPAPRVVTDKLQRYEKGELEPPVDAQFSFSPGPGL